MRGVKDFLRDSVPAMVDYILVVSTPTNEPYTSTSSKISGRHDRLNVVNSLRQRASTMPVLDREAVPLLPYLLDIPRHLAIITSAVIRNSREFQAKSMPLSPSDVPLHDFCSQCFEVEEHALLRVSQLAARISSDRQRPPASPGWARATASVDVPQPPPVLSSTDHRRPRKSSRPSTAPSPSESNSSQRRMFGDDPTPSTPRIFTRATKAGEGFKDRRIHVRSTSTDSLPSLGAGTGTSSHPTELPPDISDEAVKRKRGLLRGILRR
jgi:hypothetical protein